MSKLDALKDLLEKVEAGINGMWTFDALGDESSGTALDAFHGSLDAAKALHEAVLDYAWQIETFHLLGEVVLRRGRPIDRHYGFADGDPARAWLIAILKALISEEEA